MKYLGCHRSGVYIYSKVEGKIGGACLVWWNFRRHFIGYIEDEEDLKERLGWKPSKLQEVNRNKFNKNWYIILRRTNVFKLAKSKIN